jgi:hypothetical protein
METHIVSFDEERREERKVMIRGIPKEGWKQD